MSYPVALGESDESFIDDLRGAFGDLPGAWLEGRGNALLRLAGVS